MASKKRVSRVKPEIWSAAPTPFTEKMNIDGISVKRMVDHHVRLGVTGLLLCGTTGEGPWMTNSQRRKLVQTVSRHNAGRLKLAVQVTDNSAARILDNIRKAEEDGADIGVIAPPFLTVNKAVDHLQQIYIDAIRNSPLPIGVYDRGKNWPVFVPNHVIKRIYAEKNVMMVKDSSSDPARMRMALQVKKQRPRLKLLNGNEFQCVTYLKAGYDGLLLGGGVFNGLMARRIIDAVSVGDTQLAQKLQADMARLMFAVYGGKKISCWLSGEKRLLVELGIFRTWKSYLDYPLTESCEKAIKRIVARFRDVLLPK